MRAHRGMVSAKLRSCVRPCPGAGGARAVSCPLSRAKPEAEALMTGISATLMPQLRTFIPTARGHRPAAVKDNPVPRACWDCGRALTVDRRAFCGEECAENYRQAMGK